MAAFALTFTSAWLAINATPRWAPKPRWSEADLPSIPAEADNGWSAVTSDDLDADIPNPVHALVEDHDHATFWQDAERESTSLHAFLASSGAREALTRVDAAALRPEFADSSTLDHPAKLIDWHRIHEIALLRAVDLALAGEVARAAAQIRTLARMDAAQLSSARSMLSILIALTNLEDDLWLANALAQRDPAVLAELRPLTEVRPTVDLRAVVIIDYLFILDQVDAATDGRKSLAKGPRWLFNRGLTLREFDERFVRRFDAAVAGDLHAALGKGEGSPTDRFGWWLENPVGDLMIDAALYDPDSYLSSIDEHRATIEREREQLSRRSQG